MKTPDLSIIIPVYNVQNYIGHCINSIMRQKGSTEYEIIVVDDGSTDNTPKILNNISKHYDNISIIHQENAGVSVARNTGITASHGKYITFVDGDDMVGLNHKAFNEYFDETLRQDYGYISYYEQEHIILNKLSKIHFDDKYFVNMLNVGYATNAEIVFGGKITINTDTLYMLKAIYNKQTIRGILPDDKMTLLIESEVRENANFALFSRNFLNKHNLRFSPDMKLDEDILFCELAVLRAKIIATAPDVTYFYNNHINSLSCILEAKDNLLKYRIAYIQRFNILLNDIKKQPQYMTKDIFGGMKNLFIDKYTELFNNFTSNPNSYSKTRHKYRPYKCKEYCCNKTDCTQCSIANNFLKHLQLDFSNLTK